MKRYLLLVAIFALSCAHAPTSLSPIGARYYQADRGIVAIGTVQHTAIELNKVQVCNPTCHALVSDANTKTVIDVATATITTIKTAPDGWKAAVSAGIDQIILKLDASGKQELDAYLQAAKTIVNTF